MEKQSGDYLNEFRKNLQGRFTLERERDIADLKSVLNSIKTYVNYHAKENKPIDADVMKGLIEQFEFDRKIERVHGKPEL